MSGSRYNKVQEIRRASPGKSLASICREVGVSYSGFFSWQKKQIPLKAAQGPQNSPLTPPRDSITVILDLKKLVGAVAKGGKEVSVGIVDIVEGMPAIAKKEFLEEVGEMCVKGLLYNQIKEINND